MLGSVMFVSRCVIYIMLCIFWCLRDHLVIMFVSRCVMHTMSCIFRYLPGPFSAVGITVCNVVRGILYYVVYVLLYITVCNVCYVV